MRARLHPSPLTSAWPLKRPASRCSFRLFVWVFLGSQPLWEAAGSRASPSPSLTWGILRPLRRPNQAPPRLLFHLSRRLHSSRASSAGNEPASRDLYYLIALRVPWTTDASLCFVVLRQAALIGDELDDLDGLLSFRQPRRRPPFLYLHASLAGSPRAAGFMVQVLHFSRRSSNRIIPGSRFSPRSIIVPGRSTTISAWSSTLGSKSPGANAIMSRPGPSSSPPAAVL